MTEDGPETKPGDPDGAEGVFGNLPSTRPGSRSPRRRGATDKGEAPEPKAETAPAEPEPELPPAPEPAAAEPEFEPDPPEPRDPLAPQPGIHGFEDLAWAGVAVVAQAATAGIRFTSKALEAARKSIDRP